MEEKIVQDSISNSTAITFTLTVLPSGRQVKVPLKTNLLEAVWGQKTGVNSVCGGKGSCGKCKGTIISGSAWPATAMENATLTPKGRISTNYNWGKEQSEQA